MSDSVPIHVTAEDRQADDSNTMVIVNDYCLVTAGTADVTFVDVTYKDDGTQTHVITVKGVRRA